MTPKQIIAANVYIGAVISIEENGMKYCVCNITRFLLVVILHVEEQQLPFAVGFGQIVYLWN